MTKEEIKKAFPVGSRVVRKYELYSPEFNRQVAKVIDYYSLFNMWALVLDWENPEFNLMYVNINRWDPQVFTLVHGPAVQEPNHDGMVYNAITGKWSWF